MVTIGLSSYSMSAAINDGRMTIYQVIDYIAANGGKHLEIVPCGKLIVNGDDEYIKKIVKYAKDAGIALSSYTVGANFVLDNPEDIRKEIDRVKTEIDTGAKLGVTRMRHDAGWKPREEASYAMYEKYLPTVVGAFQELADYAAKFGITTSLENHGYLFQGSERVQRVVLAVNRPNFRTTVDCGNFLCCDEEPEIAVRNNLPFASFIHFKDFYIRKVTPPNPDGYFPTLHGRWLRGAVTGDGDIDLRPVVAAIKASDYDGFLSIEYEGREDCVFACQRALKNVINLFGE